MKLAEVLEGVDIRGQLTAERARVAVSRVDYDSRRVESGALFFALPGERADGRKYANAARERGAVAIVSPLEPPPGWEGEWIVCGHGRRAMARAARNLHRAPDDRLALTGITGTNGKTTTSYLLDSILHAAGKTTALIGTIEHHVAERVMPAANTTPESPDLYQMLTELESAGGTHATMEVSSHALEQGRVAGMRFHTAVFTNLTRDHLDFHETMEKYFAAKCVLFEGREIPPPEAAVINGDDDYGRTILVAAGTEVLFYGLESNAKFRARAVETSFAGLRFAVDTPGRALRIESALVGRPNVYNVLAACGAAWSLEIDAGAIETGIRACRGVPGRFERVEQGQPFLVVVDYAHTDDALRNVTRMARELTSGRVITLFGCGGDRDRAKRPLMGSAAAEGSDLVILTSDNPRSEDPRDIINDALVGLRRHDTPHEVEPDRARAIRRAMEIAEPGDVVILAGKGHETYQVLSRGTVPFDDRVVARQALESLGYGRG